MGSPKMRPSRMSARLLRIGSRLLAPRAKLAAHLSMWLLRVRLTPVRVLVFRPCPIAGPHKWVRLTLNQGVDICRKSWRRQLCVHQPMLGFKRTSRDCGVRRRRLGQLSLTQHIRSLARDAAWPSTCALEVAPRRVLSRGKIHIGP